MRRLIISLGALVILLAAASPVAAAPPVRQSGTFESAGAFASSCAQQGAWTVCTDVSVDFFSGPDFTDACASTLTYRFRGNGQPVVTSQKFACGPASGASVADDLSSATLSPSTLQVVECGPVSCSPTGSISVAGAWTAAGEPIPFSSRSTFTDGTCTFRQTSTGERVDATASITVDGTTYQALFATIAEETFVVSERCR